jgi:hypothetical protein
MLLGIVFSSFLQGCLVARYSLERIGIDGTLNDVEPTALSATDFDRNDVSHVPAVTKIGDPVDSVESHICAWD